MSFETEIATIMLADTSLNNLISGVIRLDMLPKSIDLTKSWLGYTYDETERIDVLGQKNIMTVYSFSVKIIAQTAFQVITISNEVKNYLTNYKSTNILDISHINDSRRATAVEDTQIEFFENSIDFNIIYKN